MSARRPAEQPAAAPLSALPTVFTAGQVAVCLGVSERQIERWTQEGLLPCRRLGDRTIRYTAEDVVALLERTRDIGVPA